MTDFENTLNKGTVKNAGFALNGSVAQADNRHTRVVQFLSAQHTVSTNEAYGMPMFSDNDSFPGISAGSEVNLIRGMVMMPSTAKMFVLDGNEVAPTDLNIAVIDDQAQAKTVDGKSRFNFFFAWRNICH